jgi:hypothetical protein
LAIMPAPSGLGPFVEIEPGDLVTYELPPMRGLGRVTAALAGGPALLSDGAIDVDFAADGFDGAAPPILFGPRTRAAQTLGPRVAWGVTAEHLLIAACVDGGRIEDSVGLDLQELARLMREVGCVRAVNLDGAAAGLLIDGRRSFAEGATTPDELTAPLASAVLVVERT